MVLDLRSSLTAHTGRAEPRCHHISHRGPADAVHLPGLLSEQHGGKAGHDAAQHIVQDATLIQAPSIAAGLARDAEGSTQTNAAVTAKVKESLMPTHFSPDRYNTFPAKCVL